jgi:hypothetical protein
MIDNNTLEKLKKAPVKEKIEIIENILDSLKNDITDQELKTKYKPFKVKKISMGQEVHVDRDNIYLERGL